MLSNGLEYAYIQSVYDEGANRILIHSSYICLNVSAMLFLIVICIYDDFIVAADLDTLERIIDCKCNMLHTNNILHVFFSFKNCSGVWRTE